MEISPEDAQLGQQPASPDKVRELKQMSDRLLSLQAELKASEENIKVLKGEVAELERKILPEAMEELGMSKITFDDGRELNIKDDVTASITKANKDAAHEWLREQGHGDLIKTVVKEDVHHMTLKAFVREQLREGHPVPDNLFSVYQFKKAVIKGE